MALYPDVLSIVHEYRVEFERFEREQDQQFYEIREEQLQFEYGFNGQGAYDEDIEPELRALRKLRNYGIQGTANHFQMLYHLEVYFFENRTGEPDTPIPGHELCSDVWSIIESYRREFEQVEFREALLSGLRRYTGRTEQVDWELRQFQVLRHSGIMASPKHFVLLQELHDHIQSNGPGTPVPQDER